jgi:RNA polymerase sigma-70 factor (ECF subfamily)
MVLASRGSQVSFSKLVDKYSDVLLNFFMRKNISYENSQDLAQLTFLKLWNYRKKYTAQSKFLTFLFLLAGQVAIDFFRREGRQKIIREELERDADLVTNELNPVNEIDEKGAMVRKAISALPEGLRDAVELGIIQELKYVEVSKILGIPEGTVKSRIFTAMKKLKEILLSSGYKIKAQGGDK